MAVNPVTKLINGKPVVTGYRAVDRPPRQRANTKTFRLKADADDWFRNAVAARKGGQAWRIATAKRTSVADLINRFIEEVVPSRRGREFDEYRCKRMAREPWARITLDSMEAIKQGLRDWRDRRLAGTHGYTACKGATINRDLNVLGPIFDMAIKEWNAPIHENPVHAIKRAKEEGGKRNETWNEEDVQAFLKGYSFDEKADPNPNEENGLRFNSIALWCPWAILLMLNIGQRLSDIIECEIGWLDLAKGFIRYPAGVVKNGQKWDCPLSDKSIELLRKVLWHRLHGLGMTQEEAAEVRLFPSTARSFATTLRTMQLKLADQHPRFTKLVRHDLRHTWTTDLIRRKPNLSQVKLLDITGRESAVHLQRYYNPSEEQRRADLN